MWLFAIQTRDDNSHTIYDSRHEIVYNTSIMKTEPKTEVFSRKPTETDRQEKFWNRNNTTLNDPFDVAQNRPLWRLMSTWRYALLVVHVRKEQEENYQLCMVPGSRGLFLTSRTARGQKIVALVLKTISLGLFPSHSPVISVSVFLKCNSNHWWLWPVCVGTERTERTNFFCTTSATPLLWE